MSISTLLHIPEIREYVRGDFNQLVEAGFISPDDIDRWVNEGYMKYATRLMMCHQGYFETYTTIDLVASQENYALPDNFSGAQSHLQTVRVERSLTNAWVPLDFRKRYDQANPYNLGLAGDSYRPTYDFRGNYLILEPKPDAAETAGVKVTYKSLPPKLRSGYAAAGGNTSITLDSGADPRDDYYNGTKIYIVSGTGAGQIRTISDYVGSTRVATISLAWGSNPDTTSIFSNLIYDNFPENFQTLLPLYACKRAFEKERSQGSGRSYDLSVLKELELDFMKFTEVRTESRTFVQPWNEF